MKRVFGWFSALLFAASLGVVGAVPAFADVTTAAASAASSFTTNGNTALASVGSAIIGLAGVAVLYKWIKGMFFS